MKEKLNAINLNGNWATLLLPVNIDHTFNYQKLANEIDMLIAAGVNGIYSNGTAGEFHYQTEEEFDTINSILSEKCLLAGMRFQIGTSNPSPIITLERLKRAVAFRPDAIQVVDFFRGGHGIKKARNNCGLKVSACITTISKRL